MYKRPENFSTPNKSGGWSFGEQPVSRHISLEKEAEGHLDENVFCIKALI